MTGVKNLMELGPDEYQKVPLYAEEAPQEFVQKDQLDKLNFLEETNHQGMLEEYPANVNSICEEQSIVSNNMSQSVEQPPLKELGNFEMLSHQQYIDHLKELHKLIQLQELRQLDKMKDVEILTELKCLSQLPQLKHLEQLAQLKQLDKLNVLEKGTRSLVIQQFIGFGLDILKLTILTVGVIFLLSRETGREIAAKALPALGFGNAAQVNLGLRLLINETSPEQFKAIVEDVEKRIEAEISMVFSHGSTLKLRNRMEILHQVQSYSFHMGNVNLADNAKKRLMNEQSKLEAETISQLEFDISIAQGKANKEKEEQLREIKLLLAQNQYPQLLEKVLPLWGTSDAITMAGVAGASALKLQDPDVLEDILQGMPGKGSL